MKKHLIHQGKTVSATVSRAGEKLSVQISDESNGEQEFPVSGFQILTYDTFSAEVDGRPVQGYFHFTERGLYLHFNGCGYHFTEKEVLASGSMDLSHKSPMPGKVIRVLVKEGEKVEEGQTLVIVEAMKMENSIKARHAGVITAVNCSESDLIDTDKNLVQIEPAELKD